VGIGFEVRVNVAGCWMVYHCEHGMGKCCRCARTEVLVMLYLVDSKGRLRGKPRDRLLKMRLKHQNHWVPLESHHCLVPENVMGLFLRLRTHFQLYYCPKSRSRLARYHHFRTSDRESSFVPFYRHCCACWVPN
jgi:hypothetical protein